MGAKIIFFLLFLFEILTLNWTSVDEQIVATINGGHFSGCELSVLNNNSTLYRKAYGSIEPRFGLFRAPVEPGMKYDINYLTQVIGINSILMQMYDQAKLNVTDRVSRHLFDFDNNGKRYITIENMLIHNSGLQATFNDTFPNTPADLLKKINNLKL